MAEFGVTAFKELARKATEESGFTAYVRGLREALDEIAAEEADEDVLEALGRLREAIGEMATVGAAAEDVVDLDDIAMGDFALEMEEAIDTIAIGVAAGDASAFMVDCVRVTIIEDFIRQLTEAVDEMAAADEAVLGAGEVEQDQAAMDGRALLDDQAQQEMNEEAFLDELDYHEIVFAIDDALDELRQEAAGCSADTPRTGFLGRYGFASPQDLFSVDS